MNFSTNGKLASIHPVMIAQALLSAYTIVAFGDSTTAQQVGVEVYSDILTREVRMADTPVQVLNKGIPKNTTADARVRFQTDVLDQNPQALIIQLGINDAAVDVWENPPREHPRVCLQEFSDNLEYFITTARERGIRVILMTPNPLRWTPLLVDLYGKPPYILGDDHGLNIFLERYVATVRQIAARHGVELIDVYASLEKGERLHGRVVGDYLLDGIHPNQKGHRLVADLLSEHLRAPVSNPK